jgi:hypothetical protein
MRTGQLVSGHQRIAALKEAGATELVRTGDWGYIVHPKTGEHFPVRFVDWDETRQRLANLVSNNPELQGEFTEDAVDQLRALDEQDKLEALQLDQLLKTLEVELQAEQAGQIDEGIFDTFAGVVGEESTTFAVTLNIDKKHKPLFESLSKDEAVDVLIEWLTKRRAGEDLQG